MNINTSSGVYRSTAADDYLFSFMLGHECQGHGQDRVRGVVSFVKYLRLQYGWTLQTASEVVRTWEKQYPNTVAVAATE